MTAERRPISAQRAGGTVDHRPTVGSVSTADIDLLPHGEAALRVRVRSKASGTERDGSVTAPLRVTLDDREIVQFGPYRAELDRNACSLRVTDDSGRTHFETPPEWIEHQGQRILIRARLAEGERIYGLGQTSMAKLDLRDTERRMWHEVRSARFPCSTGIPFMLSSRGYGLLLDTGYPSRFVVGNARLAPPPSLAKQALLAPAPWAMDEPSGEEREDRLTVIVDNDSVDFFLVFGDGPRDVLAQQSALAGRAELLPRWALGYIQSRNRYRNQEDLLGIAREFRARDIPCDVVVIDWYWFPEFGDFDWNRDNWPDVVAMLAELDSLGFRTMISLHPYVDRASRNWEEFSRLGIMVEFPAESRKISSHDAIIDVTNPLAREVLGRHSAALFQQGCSAYWIDQVQPEVHPVGSRHYGGSREAVHNRYPVQFCEALHDAQRAISDQRVFTLTFAAYNGAPRYGAVLWTGDVDPDWAIFREQIVIGQQLSLSGMPYWTTDMGGYVHYAHYDPEIFVRWFQWGVFCPLFRAHAKRPEAEPWAFGEAIEHAVTATIRLRYRLIPYLYQLMWEAAGTGLPMVRPVFMEASWEDADAAGDLQFFLGDRVLAAPVCEPGQRTKRVWLPAGSWFDGWSGEYHEGGRFVEVFAPLDRVPFFIRAGAILPWRSRPGRNAEAGSETVELALYPGARSNTAVMLDDGETYAYQRGGVDRLEVAYDGIDQVVDLCRIGSATRDRTETRAVDLLVRGVLDPNGCSLAVEGATIDPGAWVVEALDPADDCHGTAWRIRIRDVVPERRYQLHLGRVT